MKPHDWLSELEPDALVMDEHENALIGLCFQFGRPGVALYSYPKVIANLMAEGLSYAEATEYFDFNIVGAWVGEYTPAFVIPFSDVEDDAEPV